MEPELPPPFPRRWRRWALALALLLAVLASIPLLIDTAPGRRLLAQNLPGLELENGLSFRVSRIDGSLWRQATLIGVSVHDQHGRFATIDRMLLDWQPLLLARNQFSARTIDARTVRLSRLPDLKPTRDPRLLPRQDINIDRLRIRRLELAEGVAGPQRAITADSQIIIRTGRAQVQLAARTLGGSGGDTLDLALDAEPDGDIFKLSARIDAPAGGVMTSLAGLNESFLIVAKGDGRWTIWNGALDISRLEGAAVTSIANLELTARGGVFGASGRIDPARMLKGTAAALLEGGLTVLAEAVPDDKALRASLNLSGKAITGNASGRIDRASERLSDTQARIELANGAALARDLGVTGLVITAKAAGPLLAPVIDARAVAASVVLAGGIRLNGLSLAGIADLGGKPPSAPLVISVASVSGLPDSLSPLAGSARGEGRLRWQGGEVKADNFTVRSGPVTAQLGLGYRPSTGGWAADVRGSARAWPVDGVGRSDATLLARLRPGPGGAPVGSGDLRLTIADPAAAIARITGGSASVSGRFALAPGLAVSLSNLALASRDLNAAGAASWRDGNFTLAATGSSAAFGDFTLDGRGTAAAPRLAARLPRPGYGLTAVALTIEPSAAGSWQIAGDGQSALGAVELAAAIALDPVLTLDVARLEVDGIRARGQVQQTAQGPFAGDLTLAGRGLSGKALLAADAGIQTAAIDLGGNNVTLPLETPVTIDRLQLAAAVRLPASGPAMAATLAINGLERGTLVLDRADGKLALDDGRGTASFDISGNSGAPFKLASNIDIAPDRYSISGKGDFDGRQARFASPAVITHDASGWHLAATTLASGMGNATVSGDWGDTSRLDARLDKVSMGLVGLAYPDISLGGRVSGDIKLALPAGQPLQGTVAVSVNGLSRSNIASTSTPIDLGLNAALGSAGSSVRAVIVRAGKTEGRLQARLGALPGGDGAVLDRLAATRVVGQLRYAGPAQDLWGLSGLTALDVRGPVQVAADLSGTLGNPLVSGRARAAGGRVEAPLLGAVATDVALDARFTASRLELTRFSGTSGSGTITGSGNIDLSLERGFPMDIRMRVSDAAILGRDDLTATGSGAIRIATDEYGGVVSGALTLSRAVYTVGRTAVADVPVLAVTEKNTRLLRRRQYQYVAPTRWLYNLTIKADNRLLVNGMGINSEWQADVRLRGNAIAPEIFGRVQLVRGDYEFAGRRFQLTRGDIRFLGGNPPDPIIAVSAENTGNGFTALLNIDGTAQRPQIKFSSVPALPEDEVLSRVLFGSRVTDLSAPEAIQLAGALAGLRGGGGGFNPIGAVGKGLGIDRLRILPADVVTGRRTTVAAGQYVGRNVYVELATDAQGFTATSIEIGLTRSLSVLSSVATLGGTAGSVRWKRDY